MNPWHLTVWLLPICLANALHGPADVTAVAVVAITLVLLCRAVDAGLGASTWTLPESASEPERTTLVEVLVHSDLPPAPDPWVAALLESVPPGEGEPVLTAELGGADWDRCADWGEE